MTGYTKLFSSILMSSIWEESTETRLVWVTLLALADQHGHVDGTVKSLARVSRVSVDDCQKAITCLLGPDPDDRSGVMEGRRIIAEPGGWRLVNHAAYRTRMSADDRRERDRIRKRNARMSAPCPQVSADVRDFQQAEAEAEADTKAHTQTARAPLHSSHRSHAACGRVCVPSFLHPEFVGRWPGDGDKDRLVRDWYLDVEREWSGPKASEPAGEPIKFWRARFEERWPVQAESAAGKTLPAWVKRVRAAKGVGA